MNISIRNAGIDDADKIIKHIKVIAGETNYHTLVPEEFNPTNEEQIELIKNLNKWTNSLILVVENECEIVGILTLVGGHRSRTKHSSSLGISLQQKFCGKGIGHQLIERMTEWIEKESIVTKS